MGFSYTILPPPPPLSASSKQFRMTEYMTGFTFSRKYSSVAAAMLLVPLHDHYAMDMSSSREL